MRRRESAGGWRVEGSTASQAGAYLLILIVKKEVTVSVGALGRHRFLPGVYYYIGSAKRGPAGRIGRHARLARSKRGGGGWHIDALLKSRAVVFGAGRAFTGVDECALSAALAGIAGIEAPVARFGSTDCTARCAAHLYRDAREGSGMLESSIGGPDGGALLARRVDEILADLHRRLCGR
jgi:Uri superfamily endonuclease